MKTEQADYSKLTDDEFDRILEERVARMTASEILSYGEVNAILREELNNEILGQWEAENPELAFPDQQEETEDESEDDNGKPLGSFDTDLDA